MLFCRQPKKDRTGQKVLWQTGGTDLPLQVRWNVSDLQLPGSVERKKGDVKRVCWTERVRNNQTVTEASRLFTQRQPLFTCLHVSSQPRQPRNRCSEWFATVSSISATVLHDWGDKLTVADKPCTRWANGEKSRCEQVWVNRCLWSKLGTHDGIDGVFLTGWLLCGDVFDSYELPLLFLCWSSLSVYLISAL